MIPILYRPDEFFFLSNGLGRLTECSECTVTEERNGIFECEFKYPITGRFYQYMIDEGGTIAVIHDDKHDIQPFDIYSYSAPIDGVVTFFAHHISYRLANIIVSPFQAVSCALAIDGLKTHSLNRNDFTFWTNKATDGNFNLTHPDNIRALLGGQTGSILDIYGTGEYEFDKYQVKLYLNRGVDTGVTIRYGKNLTDIERKFDKGQIFNAVAPYWTDGTNAVSLSDYIVISPDAPLTLAPWTADTGDYITDDNGEIIYFQYVQLQPAALDISAEFQEMPSEAELRQKALDYLANNQPWTPRDNITVDFVQLWQTPEYENVANLQRVSLCDTVSIYYPELGVTATNAKIIKVVYNVLTERYDSMEIGTPKTSFADYLKGDISEFLREDPEFSGWQAAIAHATEMITGGLGGHVVMTPNADGEPQEILIMDTDDIETAVHVIRMNKNGIGFSDNGYSGPFESAWTIDGQFNANFIATGTLLANFIKGGTLSLGGLGNGNGILSLLDSSNNIILQLTSSGLYVNDSNNNPCVFLTRNGLTMRSGNIILKNTLEDGSELDLAFMPATLGSFGEGLTVGKQLEGYNSWASWSRISPIAIEAGTEADFGATVEAAGFIAPAYNGTTDSIYATAGFLPGVTNIPTMLNLIGYTSIGEKGVKVWGASLLEDRTDAELKKSRIFTKGNIVCNGTKSRKVRSEEFGERLLYCYETPSPLFGDVGEGVIDESGLCYVFLDSVFAETISTNQYQVFLQRYGQGDCFIAERKHDYFVVQGEPGLSFGWELKAKQKDFDQMRLEREQEELEQGVDYGALGNSYYINLEEGRMSE